MITVSFGVSSFEDDSRIQMSSVKFNIQQMHLHNADRPYVFTNKL